MKLPASAVRLSILCSLAFAVSSPLNSARGQEAAAISIGISSDSELDAGDIAAGTSFSFISPGSSFSIGSPNANPSSPSALFNLLGNESIRNELRLTDGQYGGVQKIMKASQERMSKLIRTRMVARESGQSVQIGGSEFQEMMEENRAQAEEAIEEILLPEQMDRIRQLAYQVEISRTGIGEALVTGRLGKEIGVYEDQKQELSERAAKIEAEAKLAILAIKAQARAKLFKELTPEQRKKAEDLLGDYFEYEEPSLGQQLSRSLKQIRGSRDEKTED